MIRLLSLFLLLSFVAPAYTAGAAMDAYTVRIPVGESRELDQQSMQRALLKVLVKLTGDRDLLFDTKLLNLVNKFDQRYVSRHQILTDSKPLQRELTFNEGLVNELLDQFKLIAWPTPRPSTLIWLSVRSDKAYFVASDSNIPAGWKNRLDTLGHERGVEFILPVLGLSELNQIQIDDLWSDNVSSGQNRLITEFSTLYQTNQVAIVRINKNPSQWRGEWRLFSITGEPLNQGNFFLDATQTEEGIYNVFEQMVHDSWLREREILQSSSTFTLEVIDVETTEDYALVTQQIKAARWLKSVDLKAVENDQVIYEIQAYGTGVEFLESLSQERKFQWLGREYVRQKLKHRVFNSDPIMITYQLKKPGQNILPEDEF